MPTLIGRIQGDRDPSTGKVEAIHVYDETTTTDPITGDTVGTGAYVGEPRRITRADRPALFAELDKLAAEADARTAAKRQAHLDRKAAEQAERQARKD